MPNNEKKGITVKIDAELHVEARQFLDSHEMTMVEFVAQALRDELHPQLNVKEDKYMGNTRTIAFQVPEELFQKIKDYLQRNNMTQKEFMLGLIENEIERDLAQRGAISETPEEVTVSDDLEEVFEEAEEYAEEQDNGDVSADSDGESELDDTAYEDEELDEDESESETEELSMGM